MNNSIFQKPWWLDAVAPYKWSEVALYNKDNVVARLPYVIEKKHGFKLITMPALTQTLGPWLKPSKRKYARRLAEEKMLMTELIERLPAYDYFCQKFHYSITNWLPFYWKGFSQTTHYSYVLEDLSDERTIWEGFQENIRREIRKAQKRYHLKIRTDLGLDIFLDINDFTFKRHGMALPYSREFVQRLDKACKEHESRRIFFAEDADGKIYSAVYIVWDENSAYYLMGGIDPRYRESGAMSLLMWEAIRFASSVTKRFDFEGSMIESVERFFRAFGAKQVPYFEIQKVNSKLLRLRKAIGTIASLIPINNVSCC